MQNSSSESKLSIETIIEEEFAQNLKQLMLLRLVAASLFFIMSGIAGGILQQPVWKEGFPTSIVYFLISLFLFLYGAKLPKRLQFIYRNSVQFIDLPGAFIGRIINANSVPYSDLDIAYLITVLIIIILVVPVGGSAISKLILSIEGFILTAVTLHFNGHPFPEWVPSYAVLFFLVGCGSYFLTKRTYKIANKYAEAKDQHEQLGRYFSPAVVEHLSRQGSSASSQNRIVTVLVSDVRGFTSMSEKMEAHEVVDFLNEYFTEMVDIVFKHGGTLDKFMGDGLLAYFGAPLEQPDHGLQAVRCSLEMVEALEKLNRRHQGRQTKFSLGIGLHSGTVTLGNIGSPSRQEFTIIGDTVNVASRIEGITKEHDTFILASKSVVELTQQDFQWRSIGDIKLRGKEKTMELFTCA